MTRPCGAYCRAACSPQSLVSPYRLAGSPTSAVETYTRRAPCRAAACATKTVASTLERSAKSGSSSQRAMPMRAAEWTTTSGSVAAIAPHVRFLERIVARSLRRMRRDPATGADAGAKALLVAALEARHRALRLPPASAAYRRDWNRSVVDARRALTLLQDLRDRARLIPLPEDAIS